MSLIDTCKQLVWSTRIDRNMTIWILCLILGSGHDEVTAGGDGVWVGSLFYTGFQGDLRSFYILSILLLLSYLSFTSGLSFFLLLKLSCLGRVSMVWVREVTTKTHTASIYIGIHTRPLFILVYTHTPSLSHATISIHTQCHTHHLFLLVVKNT